MPLAPRAIRVLYNVADALAPQHGLPVVDVAPHVNHEIRRRGVGTARRMVVFLHALDWWPRLTGRSRRGFAWLPRGERARLLARCERLPGVGPTARELAGYVRGALEREEGQECARAQSSGA